MATVTTTNLIDDLDGQTAADETVAFALDGVAYEIDLTDKNAATLRASLESYIAVARKVEHRHGRRRSGGADRKSHNSAVRAWAAENGIKLGKRGRIPSEVYQAFKDANAS